MDDPPAWLQIVGIASALLLIPAIIIGERIYTWTERKWRTRVRRYRRKK
jgi:hypothetical protein